MVFQIINAFAFSRMRRIVLHSVLVTLMSITACDSTIREDPMGVSLRVLQVDALDQYPAFEIAAKPIQRIDLGAFQHSRDYYFLIVNEGDRSLRNVSISLDALYDGISIVPNSFDEILPIEKAIPNAYIRLSIEHGLSIDEAVPIPIIPRGDFQVELSVRGNSDDFNPQYRLHSTVALALTSQITDVLFIDDAGPIDLAEPTGRRSSLTFEVLDHYSYFLKTGPLWAVNTGDVDLFLQFIATGVRENYIVRPSDSLRVMESYNSGWIRISPENATLDYSRFDYHSNRYTYLYFSKN